MTKTALILRANQLGNVGPLSGWRKDELVSLVARLVRIANGQTPAATMPNPAPQATAGRVGPPANSAGWPQPVSHHSILERQFQP